MLQVEEPTKGIACQYFTKNDHLYYILQYRGDDKMYYIENCETFYRMWVSDQYMREEVNWVARNSNS